MINTIVIATALLANPIKIHDVQDLTFNVPHFNNAPRFNLNDSLTGAGTPFGAPREHRVLNRKRNEEKLVDILLDLYGNDYNIRTWNGHIIVRKRR